MEISLFGKVIVIRREYLIIGVFLICIALTLWGWYLKTNKVEVFDADNSSSGRKLQTSIMESSLSKEKSAEPKEVEQSEQMIQGQSEATGQNKSQQVKDEKIQQQPIVININTASIEELITLYGIGEVKANAIITYRQQNGLFKTIEEIKKVKGIGDVTFQKIKEKISVQ